MDRAGTPKPPVPPVPLGAADRTVDPGGPRLRYGRLTAAGGAALVTCVALLTSVGLLPTRPEPAHAETPAALKLESAPASSGAAESSVQSSVESRVESRAGSSVDSPAQPRGRAASVDPAERVGSERASAATGADRSAQSSRGKAAEGTSGAKSRSKDSAGLPDSSGTGRRAVFSQSKQRVWLVGADGQVRRTYLVSGSIYDNLGPGTYEVWSRSENAVGIEDSGTMKYFVRFTRGPSGAAIGFHDIPVKDGELLQSTDALGTARSHGCIRQKRSDARAMWEFAGLGTTVVVTA